MGKRKSRRHQISSDRLGPEHGPARLSRILSSRRLYIYLYFPRRSGSCFPLSPVPFYQALLQFDLTFFSQFCERTLFSSFNYVLFTDLFNNYTASRFLSILASCFTSSALAIKTPRKCLPASLPSLSWPSPTPRPASARRASCRLRSPPSATWASPAPPRPLRARAPASFSPEPVPATR